MHTLTTKYHTKKHDKLSITKYKETNSTKLTNWFTASRTEERNVNWETMEFCETIRKEVSFLFADWSNSGFFLRTWTVQAYKKEIKIIHFSA